MSGPRLRVAALVCALIPLLAGCGDDEDPIADPPSPTSSSSPSESASQSPTSPSSGSPTTDTLRQRSLKFVHDWVEARNLTLATGDGTALFELSLPSCGYCKGLVSDIAPIYSSGGRVEGGEMTNIRSVRAIPQGGSDVMINFTADFLPSVGRKGDGTIDKEFPGVKNDRRYLLATDGVDGLRAQNLGQYG